MSTRAYPYGTRLWFKAWFRDENGVLVDPTNVVGRLAISGVSVSYTYPVDPEITKVSTGHYRFEYTCVVAGVWHYRFEGSGTYVGAAERSFQILQSVFYP